MVHVASATATVEERQKAPYAAVGIIFDSRDGYYDASTKTDPKLSKAVDNFFGHLDGKNVGAAVNFNEKFSDLIRYVNWEERWAYTGSLTTPPCLPSKPTGSEKLGDTKFLDAHIYFNVYRKVVYAPPKYIQWLKKEMQKQHKARFGTRADFKQFFEPNGWTGNHRVIQPLDKQNPVIITEGVDPNSATPYLGAFIAFLVLFILTLIGFIVACTMLCRAQKTQEDAGKVHVELPQSSMEVKQ